MHHIHTHADYNNNDEGGYAMRTLTLILTVCILIPSAVYSGEVKVGETLPKVVVEERGQMVPEYEIKDGKMVFKPDSKITYRKWESSELTGRIRTIYHLAARTGADEINKAYIDALVAANLPEYLPDSPYKTTTILNTDDAFWGTAGIGSGRLESSQKEFPYAYYVNDEKGLVREAWGLEKKSSAVIILDKSGKVLFFKDGEMSDEDIKSAISIIKAKLRDF